LLKRKWLSADSTAFYSQLLAVEDELRLGVGFVEGQRIYRNMAVDEYWILAGPE
jgi:hypothetical protein